MTNLDLFKKELCAKSAEEMAQIIDAIYFTNDTGCEYCAYDNKTCSGEDCIFGIILWLEREVEL